MPSLCEEYVASNALSIDPENVRGKHVYEKAGFRPEHRMLNDEKLYKYIFTED